ncbi:bis(5'-nucleosyl)-tetraphosphatase [asymmetrical]-like [Diabrotica virgifera virgifera]|uniref:Bis(5'-nucleosyl)-tetraphosphatase [asymmetrical] n=1 Tax=Diabrotica virgifera virgifera TaxID=50390 RepID=A0A6P7G770_DIAVI|nr:bis(5'-nucleosyl)-tetraphosphatase [asymmetrical]-like [Diabrotica virgifera virgifera]
MKVAAGFVIFRFVNNIEYLLLQASNGLHHWTPPKGHVDPGETDIMVTAFRETLEESGLTKDDLKVYEGCKTTMHYMVNNKPKEVHYFLAELIKPNAEVILSHEHQDFKWLGLSEACEIVAFEKLQNMFKEFEEWITNKKNESKNLK